MLRRVDLVWTEVSEERIASIFRVEKSVSEESAWAGNCRLIQKKSQWRTNLGMVIKPGYFFASCITLKILKEMLHYAVS
jgi:hypothetical protein